MLIGSIWRQLLPQVSSLYSVKPWFGAPSLSTPTDLSFDAVTKSVVMYIKKKIKPFSKILMIYFDIKEPRSQVLENFEALINF